MDSEITKCRVSRRTVRDGLGVLALTNAKPKTTLGEFRSRVQELAAARMETA